MAKLNGFDGLGMHMGNLARLSTAQTQSISPANFTEGKGLGGMATEGTGSGRAGELGQGWKISPSVFIQPGETCEMANIEGPGAIQQMWLTPTGNWRFSILRIYWDDQEIPSVECPVGDFFGMYRWHVVDPIRFQQDLRVTIQALGWRRGRTYLPLQDDIASVAFWYQTLPAAPFPALPEREYLEVI